MTGIFWKMCATKSSNSIRGNYMNIRETTPIFFRNGKKELLLIKLSNRRQKSSCEKNSNGSTECHGPVQQKTKPGSMLSVKFERQQEKKYFVKIWNSILHLKDSVLKSSNVITSVNHLEIKKSFQIFHINGRKEKKSEWSEKMEPVNPLLSRC